nr:hypothetical protein [uncultured bacterium]
MKEAFFYFMKILLILFKNNKEFYLKYLERLFFSLLFLKSKLNFEMFLNDSVHR